MSLIGIGLELSTACHSCKAVIALNEISQRVFCDSCRTPLKTPDSLWRSMLAHAIARGLSCAPGERGRSSIADEPEIKIRCVREEARCASCNSPFPSAVLVGAAASGAIVCGTCKASTKVRPAPTWAKNLTPHVSYVVGESAGTHGDAPPRREVQLYCQRCGADVSLRAGAREVKCSRCSAAIAVPEQLGRPLQPVRDVLRWYALVEIDEAELGVGPLPSDVKAFAGFCAMPDNTVVVAWQEERALKGHGLCRLGKANAAGRLVWVEEKLEFSSMAWLLRAPSSGNIWLIDPGERNSAREIDPKTGALIRTLDSPDEDSSGQLSVKNASHVLLDSDGSFVVHRRWTNSKSECLRRFDAEGRRIPLWPEEELVTDEAEPEFEWPDVPDRARRFPPYARACLASDRTLWVTDSHGRYLARYGQDGTLGDVAPLPAEAVSKVGDLGASGDGSVYALFAHQVPLGGKHWMHVTRIDPNLRFEIVLGVHVSLERALNTHEDRISVTPDGALYVKTGVDDVRGLRGFAPDFRPRFATPGTDEDDEAMHVRLAHAGGPTLVASHASDGDASVEQHAEPGRVALKYDLSPAMEALFSKRLEALSQTEHAREEAARQQEEVVVQQRALARQQEEARVAEETRKKNEDRKNTLFDWGFFGVIVLIVISIGVVAFVLDPHR